MRPTPPPGSPSRHAARPDRRPPTTHSPDREKAHRMAIFIDETSRVVVQGMTGTEGQKHTARMLAAGTTIVGGVNPRKAGTSVSFPAGQGTVDVPVFGTVAEAMATTGADVSVVFVPPAHAKAAVIEAVDAGMPLVVIITEGIPAVSYTHLRAHETVLDL